MISKKTFANIMERLENMDDKMDKVDLALKALSQDFCGFYVPECMDIVMDVLQELFNDNNGWLEYFVYELDFLRGYKPGNVTTAGKLKIDSWEKVYDFLIWNMCGEQN